MATKFVNQLAHIRRWRDRNRHLKIYGQSLEYRSHQVQQGGYLHELKTNAIDFIGFVAAVADPALPMPVHLTGRKKISHGNAKHAGVIQ